MSDDSASIPSCLACHSANFCSVVDLMNFLYLLFTSYCRSKIIWDIAMFKFFGSHF